MIPFSPHVMMWERVQVAATFSSDMSRKVSVKIQPTYAIATRTPTFASGVQMVQISMTSLQPWQGRAERTAIEAFEAGQPNLLSQQDHRL